MDIVARLRMWAEWDYMTESASADLVIAANEIERLREHCDRMASLAIDNAKDTERAMRLREALQEIAKSQPSECEQAFNFKMIARAALKEKE